MANSIVATRIFRSNLRKDENGKVDMKNGRSFIEFINQVRTETEAYLEMGELQMAEKSAHGLIKLESRIGYTSGLKLKAQIEEAKKMKVEQVKQEKLAKQQEASRLELQRQQEESRKRVELARQERQEKEKVLEAQKTLRQRAKEDRDVWMAHHEELDNTLTHNPFAALAGIKVQEEPKSVIEVAKEKEVDKTGELMALYTIAIEACQEVGQWEDVQDMLGEEFFMRNIDESLIDELHEAMELVADNQ